VNSVTYNILTHKIKRLSNLPAMPAILAALCDALSVSPNDVDVDFVIQQISYDKSLAAQCLRLANSALFRRRGEVASVREAVMALGIWRVRDLAFSCGIPTMFANLKIPCDKEHFWRHSLATPLLAQSLGTRITLKSQNQTYLCGLLHDIGILLNGVLFPEEFQGILRESHSKQLPIEDTEYDILGFTHTETGRILAELWRLPIEVGECIEFHHHPEHQQSDATLTLLVQAADLFCSSNGLGYTANLHDPTTPTRNEIWLQLCGRFPAAAKLSTESASLFLDESIESARSLADHVFAPAATH